MDPPNRRKLVLGLTFGGVGILLVLVFVLVYFLLIRPSSLTSFEEEFTCSNN